MGRKINNQEFINECKELHKNYYDYEKTEYIKANSQVIIKCPIHGEFSIWAKNHIRGMGCVRCKLKGNASAFKKGHQINLGRKLSEEHKNRLKLINSSRIVTKETREKLSKALKGKVRKDRGKPRPWCKGDKHPFWKGGRVSLTKRIRFSLEYNEWRKSIFQRDNYTCINCFKTNCKLAADHIKPFSEILDENNIITLEEAFKCEPLWSIDNGRCLCVECHKNTDTYGWKLFHKQKLESCL